MTNQKCHLPRTRVRTKTLGLGCKSKDEEGNPLGSFKKASDVSNYSGASGGNRFDILATAEGTSSDLRGNQATIEPDRIIQRQLDVSKSNNKEGAKTKSSTSRGKKSVATTSPKKPNATKKSSDSLFETSIYKESRIPTSLDPAKHSAVTMSDQRIALRPVEGPTPEETGKYLAKPNSFILSGKENTLPKLPDKSPSKTGFKMQPNVRIKNLKPKTKESVGTPSDELTKALGEALGTPSLSEDDMSFAEARESAFEDDTMSDSSEKEH